jgi:ATP-dependent Lon protease
VGKTSLGRSIAEAMGRKFTRQALGGVRDEAEIRGHRKTYVGAFPGRIIQKIRDVGVNNPVFMLDEVDKLGADVKGDPASALLEVLDPEQNHAFADHYLDIPFDLSRVVFITTANQPWEIPAPLLDRMEVIQLPGYLLEEKIQIARRYLIPRQIRNNGLYRRAVKFTPAAVKHLVSGYTREAGVRILEQKIGGVCRKVARRLLEEKLNGVTITRKNLQDFLGIARYSTDNRRTRPEVGVSTGLAWTPFGGEILYVETAAMPGGSHLLLTGQLGEVMRESAETALSFLRSHGKELKLESTFFPDHDLHIHVPEGATPKDGPSAGIAILTALFSLFSGRPVNKDTAMTGEITLTGNVMPIGGLKEKLLAARENRIPRVIIPAGNLADLREIHGDWLKDLEVVTVKHAREVLALIFGA